MSKSVVKNFIYNITYQIIILIIPLITVPYVSRVLGQEGIGINSFTSSITQYFVIFGTLGISLYASREIAYVRDNKEKISTTFISIVLLQIITTSISLLLYTITLFNNKTYGGIFIIQSLNIISASIDITWLYTGIEDFKKIVTRNLLIRIIGVICIFVFIKSIEQLKLYIFINSFMALLGNLSMWLYVPKIIKFKKISFNDITRNIKPTLSLFIPQIAIQIYIVLDKTMTGVLSDVVQVGFYDQSQRIVKITLGLVTSLGIVMLPRMSNMFANGEKKALKKSLNNTLRIVSFFAIPMAFGLAAISDNFIPWFLGYDFNKVSQLIKIICPIIIFIAWSNVMGMQYMIPSNMNKKFTISVSLGAVVNFVVNLILIPIWGAIGACIGTVLAELSVTFTQYIFLRKDIDFRRVFTYIKKYLFISIGMYVVVNILGVNLGNNILATMLQILVGIAIYLIILFINRDEILLAIFNKLKMNLTKRRNINEKV